MSQEECARLRESVPYVKLYRYNPKRLYPKLKGYGDNGQRILKLWQLLLTYWLPNTYWNWQEYVVSVMLKSVLNINVTCEWHKAIKLNYKNTRSRVIVVLRLPSTLRRPKLICYLVTSELPCADCTHQGHCITMSSSRTDALDKYNFMDGVQYVSTNESHTFLWPLSPYPFNFGHRCFGLYRSSWT